MTVHIDANFRPNKSTTLITDGVLSAFAPTLANLKQLHIAGCPKATHKGIEELLSANEDGITELALEGVSSSFVRCRFLSIVSKQR